MAPDARVFLTFGLLRSYKGVEDLLEGFLAFGDPDARLIVAGRADDEPIVQRLEAARAADARVIVASRSSATPSSRASSERLTAASSPTGAC